MMNKEQIEGILRRTGAYLSGHFHLSSGRHSDTYLEKFAVLQHPEHTAALLTELAARVRGLKPDVVVGPATGGIILAYELGRQLGTRALFTERENGVMKLRRGFTLEPGEKVLVVEDIVTTGGSVREVLSALEKAQAHVVGIACLVDRSGGRVDFGFPLFPLLTLDIPSWEPAACPLCAQGVPIEEPGSRYLKKR
ncbi:MAG TPA: orotate phosphoribosyltransferase [Firmicutes bacterium]|jgi:orotate phosphoribosyltransferase|nr:orotate phosphoribosyltransferase [Bacillota bacterium]HHV57130.1 orotate phosphoribosyltransferase [Bacillota bacterium]